MSLFLALYGVLLTVLFYFISAGALFFLVSVFFVCGSMIGFKEYRSSIEGLKAGLDSRLNEKRAEKNMLAADAEKLDDYMSQLRSRETMLVSLYDIAKNMSLGLTFNEIFDVLSVFLRENFIFRKSELIILKEDGGSIEVDASTHRLSSGSNPEHLPRDSTGLSIPSTSLGMVRGMVSKPNHDPEQSRRIDKVYRVYKEEESPVQEDGTDHAATLKLFSKDKKELYVPSADGTSFAAVPLLSENKFVGILTVEGLDRADFDRFIIIAMQFSLEIKKVLLYETVEELAITDSLTGLYTRRYFFERLNEELNRSKRRGFKFTYLMIDIDDFKKCNDTYGHLVGDVVLREVARIIKENTRQIDLVARYGGEEFSLVLPETDRAGARLAAERIRKKIEENIFKAYDEKLKVTVSIGLSIYPEDSEEVLDIIERADQALYAAKNSGKNIVCEYKG